ncbi:MAG TPA: MerR family transcriptional regulator [Ktedonobacteraceae bacterium]|jgi:DNA-binding transcriptional MerR regulator|nr:MerR family transcriptional regulator [Ktedonobacteraceae bacterium]
MRELLQIGEVARLVGVSTKTIRYYHEIGLLPEPERTESGYRLYAARHLLCLQRIRRLRVLGLSLERIRELLSEAPENNESTLRAALHSLVEETTVQILELEERRAFLQRLLNSGRLEPAGEDTYLFYPPALKEQLAPYLAHMSAEWLEWGQRLDAMLGSFNWPAEFRQAAQAPLQHIAEYPERYRQLFVLEERFAALAQLAVDDPEIEQLAEEYVQSQELMQFFLYLAKSGMGEKSPLFNVLGGLLSSIVAPAQQRFFELLVQKASAIHPSCTKIEQEQ